MADHYGDEQRETAYQVWAWICARNCRQTAWQLLWGEYAAGFWPDASPVDDLLPAEKDERPIWEQLDGRRVWDRVRRAVQDWEGREDWNERADREVIAVAPALRVRTQMAIATGTHQAVQALVRAVQGEDAKIAVTAAQILLDRGGFSPVGTRGGLGDIDTPPSLHPVTAGEMVTYTREQLEQKEKELRDRVRQQKPDTRMERRG